MVCRVSNVLPLLGAVFLLSGCDPLQSTSPAGTPCAADGYVISDNFDAARRGSCEIYSDGRVEIYIAPEDEGEINSSPWYAFRLEPTQPGTATITMNYDGFEHRYWPKRSVDGAHWQRLPDEDVVIATEYGETLEGEDEPSVIKSAATITVQLDDEPVTIAAQEIILPKDTASWSAQQAQHDEVDLSLLGKSTEDRDIQRLDINPAGTEVVLLTGRQHPPEVSGVFGMQGFYQAILADTEIANAFRERFHIVAVPMLNPDGVVAGHWRHNVRGTDLNRDWGPFEQAETQLISGLLDRFDADGKQVRIFVDFHSTAPNVMYTHSAAELTDPPGFADQWVAASVPRLSDYDFNQEFRPLSEQANGRNYMYQRYGIPSVTFEVGDEQERDAAVVAAGVFAEEMMRLLLTTARPSADD